MGETAVSIYKLALLLISSRISGTPRNARPARRSYKHRKKRQSLQLFSTPPSGGKWMQDLERDAILRTVKPLWASRESCGQQIQLHFDFSQSIKEKRLPEWQNSNYLTLCVRVTR